MSFSTASLRSIGHSLLQACSQGSLSTVKRYAPQLYATTGIERTAVPPLRFALATAARHGHPDILRYFFMNIPRCSQSPHGPWSPIGYFDDHVGKQWNEVDMPDLVVYRAVQGGKPAVFQTLLDFGLSVHHQIDKRGSPITVAVSRKDTEMVRFLLSKGADVNDIYWIPPKTILHRAAYQGSLEIMDLLLDYGAKIQRSEALAGAAESGRIDAATLLLDRGADINEVFVDEPWLDDLANDKPVGTALHVAVQYDQAQFVRFLLHRGARTDLTDEEGLTARQSAQKKGKTDVVDIFDEMEA